MTGDTEKSLDYLTQAAETGCLNLDWLAQDAGLKLLRGEPRFKDLVNRFKGGCYCATSNPVCL